MYDHDINGTPGAGVVQRPNRISGYHYLNTGALGSGSYFQDTVTPGEWILYILTFNLTGPAIYKNGKWRDADFFSDYSVVPSNTTSPVRIGTGWLNSFFKGAIGPVAFFNRRLTDEEIYRLQLSLPKVGNGAKFGSFTSKAVNSNNAQEGYIAASAAISASTAYSVSAWSFCPTYTSTIANKGLEFVTNTTATTGSTRISAVSDGWVKHTLTFTSGVGDTSVEVRGYSPGGTIYWDGFQVEAKLIPTPYVATDGGTATRAISRVRSSASLLHSDAGWIAARLRMGFPSSSCAALVAAQAGGSLGVLQWQDSTSNRILCVLTSSRIFQTIRTASGTGSTASSAALAWNTGDFFTIISKWDATTVGISVNGGAFVNTANTNIPALAATQFEIGGRGAASSTIDGDVLWFVTGVGALSDANALSIHGYGNSDPTA
jgi:hypothetical protein